ncbi:MAG: MarR family transcriptional regulator [Litorimonas sp.]
MDKHVNTHIDLDSFWPFHVVVLADQITRHTLSIVKDEAELNSSQWRVLAAIADKPGRTAAEVVTITPMDKTIVSRAVSSLINTGLIKKTLSQTDKRRSALQITQTGLNIYQKIAARINKTMITALLEDNEGGKNEAEDFIKIIRKFSAKMASTTPHSD